MMPSCGPEEELLRSVDTTFDSDCSTPVAKTRNYLPLVTEGSGEDLMIPGNPSFEDDIDLNEDEDVEANAQGCHDLSDNEQEQGINDENNEQAGLSLSDNEQEQGTDDEFNEQAGLSLSDNEQEQGPDDEFNEQEDCDLLTR